MPKACVLFKPSVAYRRDAFEAGLRRLGYATVERPLPNPERGDVLVLWNRSVVDEGYAKRYEARGATVLVSGRQRQPRACLQLQCPRFLLLDVEVTKPRANLVI